MAQSGNLKTAPPPPFTVAFSSFCDKEMLALLGRAAPLSRPAPAATWLGPSASGPLPRL